LPKLANRKLFGTEKLTFAFTLRWRRSHRVKPVWFLPP
jgi:hypothetical protein